MADIAKLKGMVQEQGSNPVPCQENGCKDRDQTVAVKLRPQKMQHSASQVHLVKQ